MVANFCMCFPWAILNTYTTEVYPTTVRATGVGICNTFTRIAGTLTPLIGEILLDIAIPLPYLTFGVSLIVAALCCYYLPIETLGMELSETLSDMKSTGIVYDGNYFDALSARVDPETDEEPNVE